MANTVLGIHGSGTHGSRPAGNAVPDGSLYSCTTHNLIYQSNYVGNSWATWANLAGTGFTNPMANKGEMIVGDTAGVASALAAGTSGYVLTAAGAGAFPAWTRPVVANGVARVETDETQSTAVNTWADLATSGPAVTITVNTACLVSISCRCYTSTANKAPYGAMAWAASSANTIAASATKMLDFTGGGVGGDSMYGASFLLTGLTPGSTVFTAKYNQFASAGTTHYLSREISVLLLN